MRYYDFAITNADGSAFNLPDGTPGGFTSFPNGATNPNALNVIIEANVGPYGTPLGDAGSYLRIFNPSIQAIAAQANYSKKLITVRGGMKAGLPLAMPQQAGVLFQGQIFQSYANWLGADQSLDFLVIPNIGSPFDPMNIVVNWGAGTSMADALSNAIKTAFSGYNVVSNISPNLVLQEQDVNFSASMNQFAEYANRVSRGIIGPSIPNYQGVRITQRGQTFYLSDGTVATPATDTTPSSVQSTTGTNSQVTETVTVSATAPKRIAFTDLIGQPTWLSAFLVQITTVMRGDINVNDYVTLPNTQTTTTPQSNSYARQNSIFQGIWQVSTVRHIGEFRNPDAASWVTTFEVYPKPQQMDTEA